MDWCDRGELFDLFSRLTNVSQVWEPTSFSSSTTKYTLQGRANHGPTAQLAYMQYSARVQNTEQIRCVLHSTHFLFQQKEGIFARSAILLSNAWHITEKQRKEQMKKEHFTKIGFKRRQGQTTKITKGVSEIKFYCNKKTPTVILAVDTINCCSGINNRTRCRTAG